MNFFLIEISTKHAKVWILLVVKSLRDALEEKFRFFFHLNNVKARYYLLRQLLVIQKILLLLLLHPEWLVILVMKFLTRTFTICVHYFISFLLSSPCRLLPILKLSFLCSKTRIDFLWLIIKLFDNTLTSYGFAFLCLLKLL